MSQEILSALWYLWVNNIIQVDVVIKALTLQNCKLGSLTKESITVFKEDEKFEFRYGKRD
jgi:hypothetical protein